MPEDKKIVTISINGGEEIKFDKFMEIIEKELAEREYKARIAIEDWGLK